MGYTKLHPAEAANALLENGTTVEEYQALQDHRHSRLKTFEQTKITELIKAEKELIAYGKEILIHMKRLSKK